jgi:hypothetical protein
MLRYISSDITSKIRSVTVCEIQANDTKTEFVVQLLNVQSPTRPPPPNHQSAMFNRTILKQLALPAYYSVP